VRRAPPIHAGRNLPGAIRALRQAIRVRQPKEAIEATLANRGDHALAVNAKLKLLQEQKVLLEAKVVSTPDPEPLLHPALSTVYRDTVEKLEKLLHDPDTREEAFGLIRSLIDAVVLVPVDGKLEIELRGDLAGILALSGAGKQNAFSPREKALQIKMVAGVGFGRRPLLPVSFFAA